MRVAFLFTVFSLSLAVACSDSWAQYSTSSVATNYGFAPRPDNWQPASPSWYQPPGNRSQQPIGSGVTPSASPTNWGRYPASTPSPALQISAPGQIPAADYRGVPQFPAGNAAQTSPSNTYHRGPLFESSASDASVGGPTYHPHGGHGPHQAGPQHSVPLHNSPTQTAPMHDGMIQSGPAYESPAASYWSNGGACGPESYAPKYSTPASRWFAGVYGLIMNRDQENNVWLSYDTSDIRRRVLTTHDANSNYTGGIETRFGYFFGGGASAVEVVYWGLFPGTQESNVLATDVIGDLDTILHFDGISYDPGTGPQLVSTAFFQAERHRLRRDYNLHNLELNLLGTNFTQACAGANVNLSWTAGIRYIKFDESFLYSTDPTDITFTGAGDELNYGIDTKNDLVGFQVGGRADVCFRPGFTSFVDTKVGVFANRSDQHSRIFGTNGLAEVSDLVSPYFGTPIDIRATKTDVAFVGELRAGLGYQFTRCWSATIGYRAVALTGVALSTNQIPGDFIGAIDSLRTVRTNGSLIAHGAFAGLEFCY